MLMFTASAMFRTQVADTPTISNTITSQPMAIMVLRLLVRSRIPLPTIPLSPIM